MLIFYCLIALSTGLASTIGLWPALGPLALIAAAFAASLSALFAASFFGLRDLRAVADRSRTLVNMLETRP